jgi:hypothetical protein
MMGKARSEQERELEKLRKELRESQERIRRERAARKGKR